MQRETPDLQRIHLETLTPNIMQLRKATRRAVKIKVGLQGPAGAGKTKSALRIAYGITGDYAKIAVVDTENRSSELYSDMGEFLVISLDAPFTPERYIQAIDLILREAPDVEVIILDSVSAEWSGKGGILEISNSMTGNSFTNWAKITPRHQAFVDKMLNTDRHFIATVRSKQEYVLMEKNGKQIPEKVGMAAVQREGMDYEYSLVFDIDIKHKATASKDRTGLFMDQPEATLTEETGKQLREWADSGADPLAEAVKIMSEAADMDTLKAIFTQLKDQYGNAPSFVAAKDARKAELETSVTA